MSLGIDGARMYMKSLRRDVEIHLKIEWQLKDEWFIAPIEMREDSPMMLVRL